METITLQYNQAIKEELLKVLEKFSKKDLEIIEENSRFDQVKEELHKDYAAYKNRETKLQSIDDFEKEMNLLFLEE
ncbi:hypothetical protein [Epilithonimonas sp. UC225_85]|uniref:hypothetical protein n=1 Tax=Epilithonimonas sp. UC225_85 TaxID=3350167 RepID=UPI0036D2AB32